MRDDDDDDDDDDDGGDVDDDDDDGDDDDDDWWVMIHEWWLHVFLHYIPSGPLSYLMVDTHRNHCLVEDLHYRTFWGFIIRPY